MKRIQLLASLFCLGSMEAQSALTVNIDPPEAVEAGAVWRLLGESEWRESGVTYTDVPLGQQFLELRSVEGWTPPAWDQPVTIEADHQTWISLSYRLVPRYPVMLTTTVGGFVEEEAWAPGLFAGLRPFGDSSLDGLNWEWETARRFPSRPMTMPFENFGWRVRLRAMAYPGYQFVGWSGDVAASRNPLTFIVQGPRRIQAHFAPPLTSVAASYQGAVCQSSGVARIHAQFSYPPGVRLERLEWRPELPTGWRLIAVDGLGGPRAQDGTIFFEGSLGHNPVQFNVHLEVPAEETGRKPIAGEVLYRFEDETQPTQRAIDPRSLTVQPSTGARLELEVIDGHPQVRVEGVVGETYTLEQTPLVESESPAGRLWAFMGDVTLTNKTQVFVDPFPLAAGGAIYYRASIVE